MIVERARSAEWFDGRDRVIERTYGRLTERLRYVFRESTLVQEKFAVDDYANQLDDLEALLQGAALAVRAGAVTRRSSSAWATRGVVVAGELHSPLKMLHVLLGPQDTTYLPRWTIPERAAELLALHEAAQLDLVRQMAAAGVRVMMAMDNLDTAFHPPQYVEQYSASFYEKASRICHEHGSLFFIHACGRQRDNLKLIASLGVDGLEGVAFPPLGDVELDEAMRLERRPADPHRRHHARRSSSACAPREQVFAYVRDAVRPDAPATPTGSCSRPAATRPTPRRGRPSSGFRDAWREFGHL